MTTAHRLRLSSPLIGLSSLLLGVSLVGALGLWSDYTAVERAITVFLCLTTGLSFGISISIAVDGRISAIPWLRIAAIALLVLLSIGIAIVRRNLILGGV